MRLRVTFLPRFRGNPYQPLLEDALNNLGVRIVRFAQRPSALLWGLLIRRPHVVHLHWLDPFLSARRPFFGKLKLRAFAVLLWGLRLGRRRVVWTVHNLSSHEARDAETELAGTRRVAERADAVIVHCEAAKTKLLSLAPRCDASRVHVIPHGRFTDVYPNKGDRAEARRTLAIPQEAKLFLFFGQIRPYKGVLELVDAFRAVAGERVRLLIAGQPLNETSSRAVADRSRSEPRVIYHPGFIADENIQQYLNACDVMVCPYRDILTSGSAVLAMSFARACVAPRLGCLPEQLDEQGAFFYEPGDPNGLHRAMTTALRHTDEWDSMGVRNRERISRWNWERVASMTLDVYRACLGDGGGTESDGRRSGDR